MPCYILHTQTKCYKCKSEKGSYMNAKAKDNNLHNTLVYIKQHWQLYVFFLGPALILTIVFKYLPMGGILIAFQKYNPFKGILGSEWVGLKYFQQFLSSPDFLQYRIRIGSKRRRIFRKIKGRIIKIHVIRKTDALQLQIQSPPDHGLSRRIGISRKG